MLLNLPVELIIDILATTLVIHPNPADLLCVNSYFYRICHPLLYTHLRFQSCSQLHMFSDRNSLSERVRSITVDLSGKSANFNVFRCLRSALQRCTHRIARNEKTGLKQDIPAVSQIPLETLHLRLHSYARDTNYHYFEDALSLTNPTSFMWTGPDPEHHFSIAIVAPVSLRLFRAFGTWSNIQHIKVTNIAFISFDPLASSLPLIHSVPSLQTLYIGQAAFLSPNAVAAMIILDGMTGLEQVRLVDAYSESIWGLRIRRSDIEKAALALNTDLSDDEADKMLAHIRRIVTCEKKTERIMGGDRVEGTIYLL